MNGQNFRWIRRWRPYERDAEGGDGYLHDPETELEEAFRDEPTALPLESFSHVPCLILLGERGMGKSEELKKYAPTSTAEKFLFDLGRIGSEDTLKRRIFESTAFKRWKAGENSLEIILDSLDECLLELPKAAKFIVDELRQFERLPNLRLLVACRGSVFPKSFEKELQEIWGKDNAKVLKLEPLSRMEVEVAADSLLEERLRFLEILKASHMLDQWAFYPLTLNMLLEEFRAGALTERTSQADLFERYCLFLCGDRYGKGAEPLQPAKLLAAAKWIAAAMIFGKKSSILTGNALNLGEGDGTEISLSGLAFIGSNGIQKELSINEEDLSGAIKSELFEDDSDFRGDGCKKRWKHKGYSEYLAAKFLCERKVDLTTLESIFFNQDFSGKGPALIPQLLETATWLAELNEKFSIILADSDPLSLLKSPIADFSPATMSLIVKNLLQQAEKSLVNDGEFFLRDHYSKLDHPELHKVLKPYIESKNKNFFARRMAMNIAERCKTRELLPILYNITLDDDEDPYVLENAVDAIVAIGDKEYLLKLKPLLDKPERDPCDEIKATIFESLWPDSITTKELLERITSPKQSDFYGMYKRFLTHTFPQRMPPSDLPLALQWVENLEDDKRWFESARKELAGEILLKAWSYFENPGVIKPLARISLKGLKGHYVSVFDDYKARDDYASSLDNHKARQAVALEILKLLNYPEDMTHWETISIPRYLLREEDFAWALERLREAKSSEEQHFWSATVIYLWDGKNNEKFNAIYGEKGKYKELDNRLSKIIGPFDIEGPDAVRMRRNHEMMKERKEPPSDPLPYEKLAKEALTNWDKGDLNAWWILCRQLRMTPAARGYSTGDEFDPDITNSPGWQGLGEELRAELKVLARSHLLVVDPNPEEWFGKNIFHRPAAAGYYALWLLRKEARELYNSIGNGIWSKWACIVVGFSNYPSSDENDLTLEISKDCYQKAEAATVRYIKKTIQNEYSYLSLNYRFESAIDQKLAEIFMEYALKADTKPQAVQSVLSWLFNVEGRKYNELAFRAATKIFEHHTSDDEHLKERASVAGATLLLHGEDKGWEAIKAIACSGDDFAKKMLLKAGGLRDTSKSRISELSEGSLVDLYILLRKVFPRGEDPQHEGAHFVDERDQITFFRDSIPKILTQKGTMKAIAAINEIADRVDELGEKGDFIRLYIPEARTNLIINGWTGLSPETLAELLSKNKRLVRSNAELGRVVLESLERYQAKLRGEGGLAHLLWNTNTRCPKDEEELANPIRDFIETDLKVRGIICNRNVDIRPTDEVDIKIEAVDSEGRGSYCVIVEAKGNWHPKIDSAMKSQLRDRYLTGNDRTNEGIYLVLWFPQDQFGPQCNKNNKSKNKTIDAAKEFFEKQAAELSAADIHLSSYVLDASMQIPKRS